MSLNPLAVSLALMILTHVLTPLTSFLTFFHFRTHVPSTLFLAFDLNVFEAFEIVPSFEFFQLGLINFCLVFDYLLLCQIVAVSSDDSFELDLFCPGFGIVELLRLKNKYLSFFDRWLVLCM